ncbi:hypothetical protein BJY24_002142 [Nocardia transvalensis]|uniref:Uncharacterized protein n=1 Tax=Nocardia transvalensis TaxID=37333 RepID=A0A7W9UI23_9NOCA|nr:hypothetical protein [Nocardia transvalensis]MBB5913275.1 hypothetical protein [Nocardia transvalensis]
MPRLERIAADPTVGHSEPGRRKRPLTAEQLVERHRKLPRVDGKTLRAEAEEFFGDQDRVGYDEPNH